jgi:hypothetical protein
MGRGSNRRSLKMKRRISWRKNKSRLKKKIEEGKSGTASKPKTAKPTGEASAVTRRATED